MEMLFGGLAIGLVVGGAAAFWLPRQMAGGASAYAIGMKVAKKAAKKAAKKKK